MENLASFCPKDDYLMRAMLLIKKKQKKTI